MLRTPPKHIFWEIQGKVWESKQLNGEAAWEVSKFGNLFEQLHVAFTLSNCIYMYLSKTLITFELLHSKF